jgi:rubrerythrin
VLSELVDFAEEQPKRLRKTAMTFQQTRDILDYVRGFHKRLSDFYHQLSDEVEKPRVKMLLDYMSLHEKHFQEDLAAYEEGAPRKVMDTWFQGTPDRSILELYEDIQIRPDMSLNEVVRLAFEVDDSLIEFFRGMVECTECQEVRELFINLLEAEEQEKHRLTRSVVQLEDM